MKERKRQKRESKRENLNLFVENVNPQSFAKEAFPYINST
jgi:hypothetical protein